MTKRIALLTMLTAGGMLAQSSPATDALDALRALGSVTEMGVSYRDYTPRVLDAKIKVDKYLATPEKDDAAQRTKIATAMRLHVMAAQAWSTTFHTRSEDQLVDRVRLEAIGNVLLNDPEISTCPNVKEFIASSVELTERMNREHKLDIKSDAASFGYEVRSKPGVFWQCAAKQLTDAK